MTIQQRIKDLESRFLKYLEAFLKSDRFSGPSLYFHQKTIERRRNMGSAVEAINDDPFFDYLYATLSSWGMHRMGSTATKLADLQTIKESTRALQGHIENLQHLNLSKLRYDETGGVANEIWTIIEHLKVSESSARIVANTKLLHHILPDLVPPIDRMYTYRFFYDTKNITKKREEADFLEMFKYFCLIAHDKAQMLKRTSEGSWNTSETKVLDNAIIGYGLLRLK